jgi:hypothetical protein
MMRGLKEQPQQATIRRVTVMIPAMTKRPGELDMQHAIREQRHRDGGDSVPAPSVSLWLFF